MLLTNFVPSLTRISVRLIFIIFFENLSKLASVNMLFEDFKLGFIDSIAADIEFVKDVSKVSVQLQTLTSLQHFVENCEKTNQMVRSSIKQNQQIKSQTQKSGQNWSNFGQIGSNFGQNGAKFNQNCSKMVKIPNLVKTVFI